MIVGSNILAGASGQAGYFLQRSVRLRASASAYFTRTFGVPVSQNTWTYSVWVKRGALTGFQNIGPSPSGQNTQFYFDSSTNALGWVVNGGTCFLTTQVFRDPSAWYHIVLAFNGGAASNKVRLYVNGVEVTAFSTDNRSTTTTTSINTVVAHAIGTYIASITNNFDGYLTEINFVDGQQLTANSFGAYNSYGVWSPSKYTGTYGNNGFYLTFQDNSAATAAAIGKDSSGNGNNWTPNNISVTAGVTYDSMVDVPTLTSATNANFCTLNPAAAASSAGTISGGNLNLTGTATSGSRLGTFSVSSGKWYFEVLTNWDSTQASFATGFSRDTLAPTVTLGFNIDSYAIYIGGSTSIQTYSNSTLTTYGSTPASPVTLQVAVDFDSGKIWFGINNTWLTGSPSAGTSPTYSVTVGYSYIPVFRASGGVNSTTGYINFGQRPFTYTPPTGFQSLNTFNLPTPTIANGATQFAATTFTATGTTQSITNTVNGVSFQPDLLIVKTRAVVGDNNVIDSVRGVSKFLITNTTGAELTAATFVTSFNSNGWTFGTGNYANGTSLVGWQWKASNATAVTNTSGSISSQVSANPTAGFSIVTYTGNGTAGATAGHGLGITPAMVIYKARSATSPLGNWIVWHKSISQAIQTSTTIQFNTFTGATYLNATNASSTYGFDVQINGSGSNYVAYCFSEIAGYSKFGSYIGNGSTDGPFVYLGFRPRYILTKNVTTGGAGYDWWIWDSSRNAYNAANSLLFPNVSIAETTGAYQIDFLSNGFKLRTANAATNLSTNTIIYAAFAENPFSYSLAR